MWPFKKKCTHKWVFLTEYSNNPTDPEDDSFSIEYRCAKCNEIEVDVFIGKKQNDY